MAQPGIRLFIQFIFVFIFWTWVFFPKFFARVLDFVFVSFMVPFSSQEGLIGTIVLIFLVWGVTLIFWSFIGIIRLTTDRIHSFYSPIKGVYNEGEFIDVRKADIAAIVPAHNEELVIADTLSALTKIVDPGNLFVVSDGSKDKTVEIAERFGVNVLDLSPSRGKAGALEECIRHFELASRYKGVLLVDADTRLKQDYLDCALPFFNDPNVVAIAGYASTMWNPERLSWKQLLFVSHRERVYFFSQILKFGQTWHHTNVTPIVPGFASIYRTSILSHVTMNPPGIVIEDFNMTFEVHHKKLGTIVHHPSVVAYTQDPDNARDYYRQIKRWHLGFWQTIRYHGYWPSKFWTSLMTTIFETISGSLVFLTVPILLVWAVAIMFFPPHLPEWLSFLESSSLILTIVFGVWLSDYVLTIAAAIFQGRSEYLVVGILFPVVRFLDAAAFLLAIPRAYLVSSNGRWISPSRRAL